MILNKKKQVGTALTTLRSGIASIVSPTSSTMAGIGSFESAAIDGAQFQNDHETLAANLKGQFADSMEAIAVAAGISDNGAAMDNFHEEGVHAAALIAGALVSTESARAYVAAAMNPTVTGGQGITVIEPSSNPSLGYNTEFNKASLEAFDNRNLDELRATNVLFAFTAPMQDEFGSAFFRPVTIAPDGTGLELKVRRTVIMQEVRHAETGEVTEYRPRNLLDGYTEPSLLINEATRIYPRVIVGSAESEKHFVDKAVIAPKKTLGANGVVIDSAPIRAGEKIGLIGAGANERTPGTPDQTDAIDSSVTVIGAFFRVKTSSGESIVRFNTAGFAHNGFQKSFEGHSRRIALDFHTNALFVSADTLDYNTGAPAKALEFLNAAPFEGVTLQLESHITGEGNVQHGWVKVGKTDAEIHKARVVRGPHDFDVITTKSTLDALNAEIEAFELIGYEVKAYYPNTNKRFLGLLIDTVEETVRYVIPLLPPISVQTPITGTATSTELAGPMNAQRMTNSMNAVTKLIETRDLLKEVVSNIDYGDNSTEVAQIQGFARTMIRPYLHEETINLSDVVQSTSSATRATEIQAALYNAIRYGVATMYTESRYQPVLDAHNGTAGARPQVVVGTDPRTASYLLVNGDPRLVGLGMEAKVVVSYDYRMRNQIAVTFVRPNVSEVDIMSFGTFAAMPELMTQAVQSYNNTTTNITQVQNRNLHLVTLPVLAWFKVEGLEQAASKELPYAVRLAN